MSEEDQVTSDTETGETVSSDQDTSEQAVEEQEKDWKTIAEDQRKRAEKAERELKASKTSQEEPTSEKRQEFGYGEKAYLNSLGITGTDAHNLIFEIARKSGDSIEEVAQSEYVQGKLKALKTQEATPSGSKRTHSSARDTVQYWIDKGELPKDNPELARKVVNEKINRAKAGKKFGNTDVEIR